MWWSWGMKMGGCGMDTLCRAAEGLSGTAAADAVERPAPITERAPMGRLFQSISTLADMTTGEADKIAAADAAGNRGKRRRTIAPR
jgi:hypothetical protein